LDINKQEVNRVKVGLFIKKKKNQTGKRKKRKEKKEKKKGAKNLEHQIWKFGNKV